MGIETCAACGSMIEHYAIKTASKIRGGQKEGDYVKILDDYIKEAIKVWNPPGLAVAVVKDGEVIFTKGYGVTTIGEKQKVDELVQAKSFKFIDKFHIRNENISLMLFERKIE